MKVRNKEVFRLHADLCKVMANPKRLIIIDLLALRDMNVGELAEALEIKPAIVSQHLRVLRDKNLVTANKQGTTVTYSLTTPRMIDACHILREILIGNMKRMGQIAEDLQPTDLIDLSPEEAAKTNVS
jgi:ArsR family transcriptional regulator